MICISKERKSEKIYESFRPVESVRIDNRSRQRTILNLDIDFNVPTERHKKLCDLIKKKLFQLTDITLIPGKESNLDSIADNIEKKTVVKESEAGEAAASSKSVETTAEADLITVDLNSLEISDVRSFGTVINKKKKVKFHIWYLIFHSIWYIVSIEQFWNNLI